MDSNVKLSWEIAWNYTERWMGVVPIFTSSRIKFLNLIFFSFLQLSKCVQCYCTLPICALPQVLEQCVYRQYECPPYGQPIITSKKINISKEYFHYCGYLL